MRLSPLAGLPVIGLLAISGPAAAYVGPGAGLTLLSALWGLLAAVLAALAFVIIWPIRRWRRRRQAAVESGAQLEATAARTHAEGSRGTTDADVR